MLDYSDVIDSSNSYNVLNVDAKENRISHAYLFTNQDENYLFCFAKKVSTMLINLNETEFAQKNANRIENQTHPDVLFYGMDKSSVVDADAVEKIIGQAQVCPFEADKKIFVIFNFQNISEINQNKLLKLIEEPPKNTYFLLTATSISRILITVLSRVKQIQLDEIPFSKITEMLEKVGIEKSNAEVFANCSNGNALFAENLSTNSGFVDFFGKIVSCFFDINGSKNVLQYSSYFTAKNVDKNEFFDIATIICRDLMMIISGRSELVICKNVLVKLKVIASSLNLISLNSLIEYCNEAKKDLKFNANQTAVIDGFLFKLAEVKVKCRRLLV